MMHKMTTLGLDERLERVLAYALLWVSGLVLLVFEKNQTVRWHAMQSVLTFGTLTLLLIGVSMLQSVLGWIPLLGLLTNFGLGLLSHILRWTIGILWVWLMVMAWVRPDYRLPFVSQWIRYLL
jgi:uncharacterized membrane protein